MYRRVIGRWFENWPILSRVTPCPLVERSLLSPIH